MLKRRTTAYSELKNHLKTGDIVLMKGRYPSSHVIEAFEGSDYSHAALIVLAKDIGITHGDGVLLWESNVETDVKDVILNRTKSGPQLLSFHEKVLYDLKHKVDSKVAIRHLHLTNRDQNKITDGIKAAINEVHNATFPDLYHECHDPLEGRFKNIQTPLDTIFCSELVAFTYIKMGLLSKIHPTNSYFPVDFSEKVDVGLLERAWLGKEIILDSNT